MNLTALSFAVEMRRWQIGRKGVLFAMSLPAAIIIALAILQTPALHTITTDPVFQASPCKPGYIWDNKKKKCVRKGLDY